MDYNKLIGQGKISENAVLERFADNLPVEKKTQKFLSYEIAQGHVIYISYGRGINEDMKPCIHALWGYLGATKLGQFLEFNVNIKHDKLIEAVVSHAEAVILSS